ncbi:MAG: TetR/AcrR family transcriptional regulator [Oscillospiraceae bacterium]|nr:TetR/AcrR family transcriptional regulator [Oscillospiraceae bacterium]
MRLKDQDKQQRIKDAMVRLILREGIDGASVSKIAKEAGVSPATIYVYYDSKEEMLAEVFREYSRAPYRYLMQRVRPDMDGDTLIETIVRGCYSFSREHEDVFSFVEQCSRCPTLSERVSEEECSCDILDLIHSYQTRGVLRTYSDWNVGAVLFAPVRFLAMNRCMQTSEEDQLSELIRMLQALLLY